MATNVGRTPATSLPPLREVSVSSLDPADTPVLRIKTDEDVEAWKHTRGYQDYGLFLRRLAESVVGYDLPHNDPEPHQVSAFVRLRIQWAYADAHRLSMASSRWSTP